MKNLELHLSIQAPFGNLYRKATALVAVYKDASVILGGKRSYPNGIYRLLGGGIEDNRDSSAKSAAVTELLEETNVRITENDLIEHAKIAVHATDSIGNTYTHTVYLYGVKLSDNTPFELNDDVDFVKSFSRKELQELITKYENLPQEIDADAQFAWFDYGQMYAPIHTLVLEHLPQS